MKLDDEVKMISAEAPLLFAKAAEIFIHELTLRAWIHTEENKRRTLQVRTILFKEFIFLLSYFCYLFSFLEKRYRFSCCKIGSV